MRHMRKVVDIMDRAGRIKRPCSVPRYRYDDWSVDVRGEGGLAAVCPSIDIDEMRVDLLRQGTFAPGG